MLSLAGAVVSKSKKKCHALPPIQMLLHLVIGTQKINFSQQNRIIDFFIYKYVNTGSYIFIIFCSNATTLLFKELASEKFSQSSKIFVFSVVFDPLWKKNFKND